MKTIFELGDITIHRIVDREFGSRHAFDFFRNLTPEILDENRQWMRPSALDAEDRIVLCFQSYIIRTRHHNILVDSCYGNEKPRLQRPAWHMRTDETYMRNFAGTGLTVNDIDFVMCTHLHADHVGWNTRLQAGVWVPTFPRARYLFSEAELGFWTERHKTEPLPYMHDSVLPIVEAGRADLVTSSFALGDHVRLLSTPGHTPDHFAVRVGRDTDLAVLTGDVIHSPLQMRYPHLTMGWDNDPDQAVSTRLAFLEHYCDTDTLCCTAHFPSPSVGRITRWADGFRCDPV